MNEDDADQFILDGMYRSLKAVDLDVQDAADVYNATDEAAPAAAGTSGESAAPLDFVPCGWFAYKTMGPCAKREFQSHLIEFADWPKNKQNVENKQNVAD